MQRLFQSVLTQEADYVCIRVDARLDYNKAMGIELRHGDLLVASTTPVPTARYVLRWDRAAGRVLLCRHNSEEWHNCGEVFAWVISLVREV